MQVIPTARNAHAIRTDNTNRFVFVPHLGTDQVFQFLFDEKSGRLTANTPPVAQLKDGTGPRHLITSPTTGSCTSQRAYGDGDDPRPRRQDRDAQGSEHRIRAATRQQARSGAPRGAIGAPGAPVRDTSNDIWASDLHLTPNGKFLYAAERTSSSIGAFGVDAATGNLTYLRSTPTEKQPRGFRIDPAGRFMVVSGEKSDTITSYSIVQSNGSLVPVGKVPTGKGSNWVEIVSFD